MTGAMVENTPPEPGDIAGFIQLVQTACDLQASGQSEQALAAARYALASAPAGIESSNLELANAFNMLGVLFFRSGYFRTALPQYKRALMEAQRCEASDGGLLASLNNNLGQVHEMLGELEKAQEYLEVAVSMDRTAGSRKSLGYALDNLARVLGRRGDLSAAMPMHEEALAIFRREGGTFDPDVATALSNISSVYVRQRDFGRAEAYRLRALDAHRRTSGLTGGATLADVASLIGIYWDCGDVVRADVLVAHLLSLGGDKATTAHRNLAEALRQLLKTAFYEFRLDVAERLAIRVVELLEVTEGPLAPETLEAVELLGDVYRSVGDRNAAEAAYRRAREGYQAKGMPDNARAVAIELAKLYCYAGAYELAAQVLTGALGDLRSKPERDSQEIANVLGNLALVHFEAERYDAADTAVAEALAEITQDPKQRSIDRPWLLHNRALFRYHLGDHKVALELYEEAKRLWTEQHGPDHPFIATCAANLALVHWAMDNESLALSCFQEAEKLREHEMQRILAVGSEKKRTAYARELVHDLHKMTSFYLATSRGRDAASFTAQMLLRRKGRVLDALTHSLTRLRESSKPEDHILIARLQEVRREMATLLAPVLITRRPTTEGPRLRILRAEEEQLEASLSYRGALYRPILDSVMLRDVVQCLGPDRALIDILRYTPFDPIRTGKKEPRQEPNYAAVVLRASGDPQWFNLGPASVIDTLADRWRMLLRDSSSDFNELRATGSGLYRLLIQPLLEAIGEVRGLLVSPDGRLVLIPFGLLSTPDGRSVKDDFIVSYLSSGRELLPSDGSKLQADGVVIMAAPDFDAIVDDHTPDAALPLKATRKFAPLPGTYEEGKAIELLLEGGNLLTGRDATVQSVRSVKHPVVLHVATHGIFSEIKTEETRHVSDVLSLGITFGIVERVSKAEIANPMYGAGLVFAGANRLGCGVLTAQEIATIDLRGTALAVLSACDTGLGTVKEGEEFTGLRRALAIAGAETQVTSLWQVDDAAGRQLMIEYYRLLAAGKGRAEALQLAQAELAATHEEWSHPAYWAAFISAGADGPVGDRLMLRQTAAAG